MYIVSCSYTHVFTHNTNVFIVRVYTTMALSTNEEWMKEKKKNGKQIIYNQIHSVEQKHEEKP